MARYYDFDSWLTVSGVKTQEDYQNLFMRVSRKKTIYLCSFLGLVILSLVFGVQRDGSCNGLSLFFSFLSACVYPFFFKAYSFCKAFEIKDFNAKTNFFLYIIYLLCFILIVPLVIALIIKATNWGLGLNNWDRKE